MADVRYITLVDIDEATMSVRRTRGSYRAVLAADGITFAGSGPSVTDAIEAVLKVIKAEKRPPSKNPGKRYRVAVSLRENRK